MWGQFREGQQHCGEMVPIKGSHHDWFEGRGPSCVFMGYVDHATRRVYGMLFVQVETIPRPGCRCSAKPWLCGAQRSNMKGANGEISGSV